MCYDTSHHTLENLEAEQLSEPSSSKNQETKAAEKFEVTSTSATQPAGTS